MAKPLSWGAVPWSFLPAKREPDEAGFVGVPLCGAHSEPEERRVPQARPWGVWWQSPAPSRQACPTARGRIRRAVFPDGHTPKPGRAGWSWRGGRLPRDPGGETGPRGGVSRKPSCCPPGVRASTQPAGPRGPSSLSPCDSLPPGPRCAWPRPGRRFSCVQRPRGRGFSAS